MGAAFSEELARPSSAWTRVPLASDAPEPRAGRRGATTGNADKARDAGHAAEPSDASLNELRAKAFRLIHYNDMQRHSAYRRYGELWHTMEKLRARAGDRRIVEEARANNSEQSPEMLKLFNDFRMLTTALRRERAKIVQIQGTLDVYKELVDKVEACLRGENDHRLLSDYVRSASAIFAQSSKHGNPLDELERVTSEVHERIANRADTRDVLTDEVRSLNETEHEDNAEVAAQHTQTLQTFMQRIARGADAREPAPPASEPPEPTDLRGPADDSAPLARDEWVMSDQDDYSDLDAPLDDDELYDDADADAGVGIGLEMLREHADRQSADALPRVPTLSGEFDAVQHDMRPRERESLVLERG
jgi:hypothetical protein